MQFDEVINGRAAFAAINPTRCQWRSLRTGAGHYASSMNAQPWNFCITGEPLDRIRASNERNLAGIPHFEFVSASHLKANTATVRSVWQSSVNRYGHCRK